MVSDASQRPAAWSDVPCPACDDDRAEEVLIGRDEFFGLPGSFRLVRCRGCDLVYICPQPPFETILDHYPPAYYSFHYQPHLPSVASGTHWAQRIHLAERGYKGRQPCLPARVAARVYGLMRPGRLRAAFRPIPAWQAGGRLLDVGCGSGSYLTEVSRLGWTVSGVDVSPLACEAAAAAGLNVHCGTVRDAPFAAESFDVVTLWETLEHIPDPRPTLGKIRTWLVPGGRLLGSVPNFRTPYAWWFGAAYCHLDLPRHFIHFSVQSLAALLARAGFDDIRIRTHSAGGDAWLLSRAIRENRRRGRLGLDPDFWAGKTGTLRLATRGLKPLHLALDALGRGLQLEFEGRKSCS